MVQRKITACVIDNALGYVSSFEVRIPVENLAMLGMRVVPPIIEVDRETGFPIYVAEVNQFSVERVLSGVGREHYVTLARYLQAVQAYDAEVAPLIEELAYSLSAAATLARDVPSRTDILSISAVFRENPVAAKGAVQTDRIETHWRAGYEYSQRMYLRAAWEDLRDLPQWFLDMLGVQEGCAISATHPEAMQALAALKFATPLLWIAIDCNAIQSLATALKTASAGGFSTIFCKMDSTPNRAGTGDDVVFTFVSLRDGYKPSGVKGFGLFARINQETGGSAKPIVRANFHRRLRNTKPPKGTEKP